MLSVGRQWLITELAKFGDELKGTNKEMQTRLSLLYGIDVHVPPEPDEKEIISPEKPYPKDPTDAWLRQAIIQSNLEKIDKEKRDEMISRLKKIGFDKLEKSK
jgi:hypothetical protein